MQGIHFVVMAAVGFWCASALGDVTIRGRVVDGAGKPIAGALVFWLRPAPINSYPESVDGKALAGELVEPVIYSAGSAGKLPLSFVQAVGRVTDQFGLASFPALSSERLRTVRVVSPTCGTQELSRMSGPMVDQRTIQLRRPGRVELRFDLSNGMSMRNCKMLAFTTAPEAAAGVLKGPVGVSATRRDPITRVSSGSSSLIERVVGPEGLEFPELILTPREVATK